MSSVQVQEFDMWSPEVSLRYGFYQEDQVNKEDLVGSGKWSLDVPDRQKLKYGG